MESDKQLPQGGERGEKSRFLTQAEGGILDTSEGYEYVTEGAPEQGLFRIVGGYLDEDGVVHDEVHLRAMSGNEEDLLGNDAIPFFRRMTGVLAQCCVRIGTLTDRQQVIKAIRGLPAGARQHLLVCLRRTSHWRATKDIYDMKVECPKCGKDSSYKINLAELELYQMPDPKQRAFHGKLPETGFDYHWAITTFDQDEILSAVVQDEKIQSELLTWSILIRLVRLNGTDFAVKPDEVIDLDSGKLRKNLDRRVAELRLMVKNLPTGDRQYLRDEFMAHEPGIENEIEMECPSPGCKKEFLGRLDFSQRDFFFPSATRKRSKRRSFT